jgi:aspartyl/asparaginyl beta-hydroxylase (cupin superfamily)
MSTEVRHRKTVSAQQQGLPASVHDVKVVLGSVKKDKSDHRKVIGRTVAIFIVCLIVTANQNFAIKAFIKDSMNNFWWYCDANGYLPFDGPFELDFKEDYPEMAGLAEHYPTIRAEVEELLAKHQYDITYVSEVSSKLKNEVFEIQWKSFFLKHRDFIPENTALCPKTAKLLEKVPNLYTAFFSILGPGEYIKPHWGYYKGYLRYLLGVIVPEGEKCWLRVHPDIQRDPNRSREAFLKEVEENQNYMEYRWKNGEAMLFDDTVLHRVKNDSDEIRVVLFMDFARKMPWYLDIINKVSLWFTHRFESTMYEMRKNAVFKPRPRKE